MAILGDVLDRGAVAGVNRTARAMRVAHREEPTMSKKAGPKQAATVEELLWSVLFEQEALRRVLVRKGIVSNDEVFAEIKTVRQELTGKPGK